MKITIFTGVNPVNYEYFFYFIDNFRKMSSGQNELCFKVLTGPARGQITTLCNERQINSIASKNVDVINGNHLPGLGESINYSLQSSPLDDGEITLISDIDVVMLKKNWDIDAVKLLQQYDVIGLPFEETSMFSYGKRRDMAYRYHGSPSIVWMMFRNNPVWKNVDFRHSKDDEHVVNEEESKIFQIPKDTYLSKDVGWRIPQFIHDHNFKKLCFTNINKHSPLPRRLFANVPIDLQWGDGTNKSGWPCDEGMLGDNLFLAHQKLSQRWRFKNSNVSRTFYDLIDDYINSQNYA